MIETGKTYLVTGGTGFLGKPLVKRLTEKYDSKIVILSRNHGKLIDVSYDADNINIISGDVADKLDVEEAMKGVDGVFHLAASKHVGLAERLVRECLRSNTLGSLNILESSLKHNPKFVIGISTDKAAQVSGIYGASKLMMEGLFKEFQNEIDTDVQYRIVRYGNVLYSTGSVLCKWLELIKQGKNVTITEPHATRFFWTVDSALDLIEDCLYHCSDASPFVPEMKGMSIGNLLKAMVRKYLGIKNIYLNEAGNFTSMVNIIGLQSGENMHEKITSNGLDSSQVEQYTIEEIMEII